MGHHAMPSLLRIIISPWSVPAPATNVGTPGFARWEKGIAGDLACASPRILKAIAYSFTGTSNVDTHQAVVRIVVAHDTDAGMRCRESAQHQTSAVTLGPRPLPAPTTDAD
jgi:hypothetical protein